MTRRDRRARQARRRMRTAGAPCTAVMVELVLTGRRADVVAVERVGRSGQGVQTLGRGVADRGHQLAGARVVLVGEERAVARIERMMRRAASSRFCVVEPLLNLDDRVRASRISRQLLGQAAAAS